MKNSEKITAPVSARAICRIRRARDKGFSLDFIPENETVTGGHATVAVARRGHISIFIYADGFALPIK